MKMMFTGDSLITRRLSKDDPDQSAVASLLQKGDVRFTNLEVTVHDHEGYPAPVSGGTWAMTKPAMLDDLLTYGFNVLNWANNHSLDYLHGGLLGTKRVLDERDLVHTGAGATLTEASSPVYLETASGRVALIGATSTFAAGWEAADPNRFTSGRPGVNMIRIEDTVVVPEAAYQVIKETVRETDLRADHDLLVKEGFEREADQEETAVGPHRFIQGHAYGRERTVNPADLARLEQAVSEARLQADYVCVSLHTHEMKGTQKDQAPAFMEELSRALIDAGADVIAGHGPHILRGIELYKNKPIFYSLGNFLFENDTVRHLPRAFFDKYGLGDEAGVAKALNVRSQGDTRGLGVNPDVWQSVIVEMDWAEGKLVHLRCHPITLHGEEPSYRRGVPALTTDMAALKKLADLSAPYGTRINADDGTVTLPEQS